VFNLQEIVSLFATQSGNQIQLGTISKLTLYYMEEEGFVCELIKNLKTRLS